MFLLSVDGNGATCSRIVSALKSNSVLIKYESDSILYYFSALEPGSHFISVNADRDVEGILDQFDLDPQPFYQIAAKSRSFYENYLTRDKVVEYTGRLLRAYAEVYNSRA
jgi:hypothetical protein